MKIERLFQMVLEFASKDANRSINHINVHDDSDIAGSGPVNVLIEATDGHRLLQLRIPKPQNADLLAKIPLGLYDQKNWKDFVCKGYVGAPDTSDNCPTQFPDCAQVIPAKKEQEKKKEIAVDGHEIEYDSGLQVIGINPSLLLPLAKVDLGGYRWQFSDAMSPVRLDCSPSLDNAQDAEIVAVFMPIRLK